MNIPDQGKYVGMDNIETVVLKPREMQLLGAAAVFMLAFLIGIWLALSEGKVAEVLMLTAIFGCLTLQGMRK